MAEYFPEDLNVRDQRALETEAKRWLSVVRKDKYACEVIRSQRWQALSDSLYTWLIDRGETRVSLSTQFNDREDMLEAVGRWADAFVRKHFNVED